MDGVVAVSMSRNERPKSTERVAAGVCGSFALKALQHLEKQA
jgi:hypothetical protein